MFFHSSLSTGEVLGPVLLQGPDLLSPPLFSLREQLPHHLAIAHSTEGLGVTSLVLYLGLSWSTEACLRHCSKSW